MLAIPVWERRLSYAVWIFHSLAAFAVAYYVSHSNLNPWFEAWLGSSSYFPGHKTDTADTEWTVFRASIPRFLIANFLHSIGFAFTIRYAPSNVLHLALAVMGLLGQVYITSLSCVVFILLFGFQVTLAVYWTRSKVLAWVLCIGFVIKAPDYMPFHYEALTYYREFNVYLYGAIKILNFCLHLCNNPQAKYSSLWREHLVYLGYLPYSLSLIVLFEDFRSQLQRRLARSAEIGPPNRSILYFGLRIASWFLFYDLILHVIFANTIYHTPFEVIARLGIYSMCCVSYVAGQFFHVKYVVIFGLPSFFAYFDGLTPPPPPICISRVSRYSRMWRHFDYGLYQFLKHQVYIPIMKPSLPPVQSVLRALVSLVAVFSIVIAWHGARPHYIAWVSLSALELIIEKIGSAIWATSLAARVRSTVGPQNSRRIVAISMIFTVIPGIFGVFFFLGDEGVGSTVFTKVLMAGLKDGLTLNIRLFDPNSAGFILLHLVTLGYFFNNVCLDLDARREKIKVT